MSALGQKSTLKRHHPMSALPPKADIHAARAAHSREPARARWNQPKFLNDFSRARACACAQDKGQFGGSAGICCWNYEPRLYGLGCGRSFYQQGALSMGGLYVDI